MATSLALLGAYESDTDEDKPKNGNCELNQNNSKKRLLEDDAHIIERTKTIKKDTQSKLPPPNISLKETAPSIDNHVSDDPDAHNGRIRSFAHERGNWVTFVHVQYEDDGLLEILCSNLKDIYPKLQNVDDYHVSVTKTFVLRHHWIDSFVSTMKEHLSPINRFHITFGNLEVYRNEDKTRTFIGLTVNSGLKELITVVEQLDKSLCEYKLPVFYKDPSFHMSILWCTGDHKEELTKMLDELNEAFYRVIETSADMFHPLELLVDRLICKTGNKLFHLPF